MTQAYNLLGEMARMGKDYNMAEHYYNKCLALAKETGEIVTVGIQYANLGMLACQKGNYLLAEKITKQGLRIFLDIGAYYGIHYDIGALAGAALGLGKPKRSARLLRISNIGLETLGILHQKTDRSAIHYILDETRKTLDEKSSLEAWEKGQRMTIKDAFTYALESPV